MRSVALVYDTDISGQHYTLCVWLISAKGVESAVNSAWHRPLPWYAAGSMWKASAAQPPHLRVTHGAGQPIRQGERVSGRLTDEACSLLMPNAIAAKLGIARKSPPYSGGLGYWFPAFAALPLDRCA